MDEAIKENFLNSKMNDEGVPVLFRLGLDSKAILDVGIKWSQKRFSRDVRFDRIVESFEIYKGSYPTS